MSDRPRAEKLQLGALAASIASVVGVLVAIVGGSFWLGGLGATVATTYESVVYTRNALREEMAASQAELTERIDDAIRADAERDSLQQTVNAALREQIQGLTVTIRELVRDNEWFKLMIRQQGAVDMPSEAPG